MGDVPKDRSVRDCMPVLYAWIESLRAAFGREGINAQLAKGLAGQSTLWLSENGHVVGAPGPAGVPLSEPPLPPKGTR